jgi:hypothetical protein
VRASRPQSLARAAVVGGTNFNFAELNRDRPDPAAVDGVVYSVTPQIHDTDEAALVQSLEGQRDTVVAARSFSGHLPVHIGAVTLKPRLNQATAALGTGADELTGETDERQKSLFAAAWTAMSVKYLTEAGAASLTFFELTGPGGTLARTSEEGETGGTLGLFPVYHVLRHLNAWRGAEVVPCHSNRALAVEAFAARRGGRLEVIVANLTLHAQTALVRGLPSSAAELCVLDEETVVLAGNDPGGFERTGHPATVGGGCLTLGLQPLAVVRVTTRAA